jgi:hypothetical protein
MDAKKKRILAASLILLWAGLAVWQWRLQEDSVRVPLANVTGQPSVGRHAETKGTGLRVNLDLLASTGLQRQTTFTAPRNIFSMPHLDGAFASGSAPTSMNQPGSASAETSMQQEDESEFEQYRYLGFLRVGAGYRNNKDIALLRRDDEVLVLKVGDRVDDHLILKAINSESVTIRDTGTHMDQTVPLSEEPADQAEKPTGQE